MTYEHFLRKEQEKALSLNKEESAVIVYLMYVTGYSSSELYLHMQDSISKEVMDKFREGFDIYLYKNKPIQYLVGYQTFYGYDYYIDERCLIPRFETEELVENVLMYYDTYFAGKEVDACDIGTGSGAIGISLALEEPHMHMVLTDISSDALEVASKNNELFHANVTLKQGDMLEPLKESKFDIIVSNPPYIPEDEEVMSLVKDNEPNIALFGGKDGLKFYRVILSGCKDLMKDRCLIAFEHGYNKNEAMRALALEYFPKAQIVQKKDMQGKDRMTFIFVGDFDEVK